MSSLLAGLTYLLTYAQIRVPPKVLLDGRIEARQYGLLNLDVLN